MAEDLENRASFRRVQKMAIQKAMKNGGLNAAEFGQLAALCEQMVDALPADLRKKYDSYSR